jgi:hypothetical protein
MVNETGISKSFDQIFCGFDKGRGEAAEDRASQQKWFM